MRDTEYHNDWMHLFLSMLHIRWFQEHNEISIVWEWIPCGNKDLVCVFTTEGKNSVSGKQAVHYGGDWWLCKIRASSYSFAGYKLGKCNCVNKYILNTGLIIIFTLSESHYSSVTTFVLQIFQGLPNSSIFISCSLSPCSVEKFCVNGWNLTFGSFVHFCDAFTKYLLLTAILVAFYLGIYAFSFWQSKGTSKVGAGKMCQRGRCWGFKDELDSVPALRKWGRRLLDKYV